MREDGFYWTAYKDGGTPCVEVRFSLFSRWLTTGLSTARDDDTFVVLSDRLVPPPLPYSGKTVTVTPFRFNTAPPEARPKSGMTDAERALLLNVAKWCGGPVVRAALAVVEAEAK